MMHNSKSVPLATGTVTTNCATATTKKRRLSLCPKIVIEGSSPTQQTRECSPNFSSVSLYPQQTNNLSPKQSERQSQRQRISKIVATFHKQLEKGAQQMANNDADVRMESDPSHPPLSSAATDSRSANEEITADHESLRDAEHEAHRNLILQEDLSGTSDLPKHWKRIEEYDFTVKELVDCIQKNKEFAAKVLSYTPHEWQLRAAALVQCGEDVVLIAGTGSGKSTVFLLLMTDTRTSARKPLKNNVLVISPLTDLLTSQADHLNSLGFSACALTGDNVARDVKMWKDVEKGKYQIVLACPEILLSKGSHFWTKMAPKRDTNPFLKRLCAICIDEAHTPYKYGESGFRPEFAKLGSFRNLFHNVPFLLMSATIPPNVREYLHVSLKLSNPTCLLQQSIARYGSGCLLETTSN